MFFQTEQTFIFGIHSISPWVKLTSKPDIEMAIRVAVSINRILNIQYHNRSIGKDPYIYSEIVYKYNRTK